MPRTAAIGLLDNKLQQFGTQSVRIADMQKAGDTLCEMAHPDVMERFKAHQDASKAANFCGDVAYLTTMLLALGFPEGYTMTMTNKIKDVELVWTLGAMLAKSAELRSSGGAGSGLPLGGPQSMLLLGVAALLVVWYRRRAGSTHGRTPLGPGHDSD